MSEPNPLIQDAEKAAGQAVMFSAEQLAAFVEEKLAREREAHKTEMAALQANLSALAASVAGSVPTLIREHGAGIGTAIHETWSQFEQELARKRSEEKLAAAS